MNRQRFLVLGFGLAAASFAAWAQAPLEFEVATVKSTVLDMAAMQSGRAHIGTRIDSGRVDIGTAPLFRLICAAYRLKPYQVVGPDWMKTATFDVQGKIPAGVSTDKVPEMLQALLAQRFGLKLHHESREQAVYALVQAKGGAKLTESAPAAPADAAAKTDGPPLPSMAIPTLQGDVQMSKGPQGILLTMPGGEINASIRATPIQGQGSQPKRLHLESSNMSMKTLAELLSTGAVDRVVLDQTGLKGSYDIAIDISEFDAMGIVRQSITFMSMGNEGKDGVAPDPSGSALRASIQNLGLSLEAKKLPIDIVVIDHAEKTPAEN
jgi:uncharacterized protein (TIGR03435 family)